MKAPFLVLSGTAAEIGRQHGREAAEAIAGNFTFYSRLWQHFSGVSRDRILQDAAGFLPCLEAFDGELISEMEGIAVGSGRRFEEILALNCRWELNYAYIPARRAVPAAGCTSFALLPPATRKGRTFVGQNWDYKPRQAPHCLPALVRKTGKPAFFMHTEAGIIGHKGCNDAGIGTALNYIRSSEDCFKPGLPFLIKARAILEAVHFSDCLKLLLEYPGPNSGNILLAHRDGEAIDAECLPDTVLFLHPQAGVLCHANHFESPRFRGDDTGRILLPDSLYRSHRLERLFRAAGRVSADGIQEILGDHFGHPDSICRHPDPRLAPEAQWETLTSLIMGLDGPTLRYTEGPPCSALYTTLDLKQENIEKSIAFQRTFLK